MEYLKHFGSAGEYYPAFFEMKLKIDEMIDFLTLTMRHPTRVSLVQELPAMA